jgi:hypothetical protein
MSTTAVGHCSHCAAVVNLRWPNCLVCQTPLPHVPKREETEPTIDTGQAAPAPPVQAGAQIQWQRAGQVQQGLVDFIHVDDTGTRWAFVTIGESWTAVNLKFVILVEEGDQS